jgi:3-phenylpropionate/trans-cinnamate dioxygenase ferredoxin component
VSYPESASVQDGSQHGLAATRFVCRRDDLGVGQMRAFTVGDRDILLIRASPEQFYAVESECTHAEAQLELGELLVKRCEIECPLHGGRFNFTTGEPTEEPAEDPLATFPVTVDDGDVRVDLGGS